MDNKRAKARQLDVMANISGVLSLLHDFSPARKETSTKMHVNLSNVRRVDSIGLSILLGLLFIGKSNIKDYEIQLTWSNSNNVNETLRRLEIVELLSTLSNGNMPDGLKVNQLNELIDASVPRRSAEGSAIYNSDGLQEIILFCPTLHANRQAALDSFSRSLKKFVGRDIPRTFNHEQIIKVFIELAKNTYDHSCGFGIAGLFIANEINNSKTIQFVYCDTGDGICRNVRSYLEDTPDLFGEKLSSERLKQKGSAIDFLHRAFQAGFSTKLGNDLNYGMGLTLIAQGATGCGFNVWLKDADSMIDLTGLEEPYTHEKLRARSCKTTAPNLLVFHLEREKIYEPAAK